MAETALEVRKPEIVQYDQLRQTIEGMKERNASLFFDYDTPSGNKEARSHVFRLRQTKADVERVRKAAKADALEYGRRVDSIARELTAEVESMIAVHQGPIDEIERREKARTDAIEAAIQEIRGAAEDTDGRSAEVLRDRLGEIRAQVLHKDQFQEFLGNAEQAKTEAIELLTRKVAEAEQREAEQAELSRLRAESAERDKREREERIAREAAERARAEAEAKAKAEIDEARRREQAAAESERKALQSAREAMERAERERQEAKAAEEREAAERAANQHIREIVTAELVESITAIAPSISAGDCRKLACAMLDGEVGRITVCTVLDDEKAEYEAAERGEH